MTQTRQDADHYFQRGSANFELGEYVKAVANFTTAIELDSSKAHYFNERGISYDKIGDRNASIQDYSQAINLKNNEGVYFYNRACGYMNLKKYQEALDDLNRAIEIDQSDADYFSARGSAYLSTKQFDLAINDCTQAIELEKYSTHYYRRADAYSMKKMYVEAIEDINTAIERSPNNTDYYIKRAEIYQKNDQLAQAFADQVKIHRLTTLPPLKEMCKFFVLSNHGRIIACNGVRNLIQHSPIESGVTDMLRNMLEKNNITPDTISFKRKEQGIDISLATLFDEIRKEEKMWLKYGCD